MRKLGPWVLDGDDHRRYWTGDDLAADLAAIVGYKPSIGLFGWRAFAPEDEPKWIREGDATTVAGAKAQADNHLRAHFGVPKLELGLW